MQKLVFFTSVIVTLAAAFGISIQPGINSWFETATEAGSPLFEHASPEPQSVSFYGEDVDPEFALLFESMTDGRDELAMSELPEENTSVEFGDPEPMSTFCSTSDNESICSTGEGLHVLCSVVSLSVSSLLRCSALGTESTGSAAYCSTTDYGQSGNKCSILLVWSGAQRCSTNLHRCSAEGFKFCGRLLLSRWEQLDWGLHDFVDPRRWNLLSDQWTRPVQRHNRWRCRSAAGQQGSVSLRLVASRLHLSEPRLGS